MNKGRSNDYDFVPPTQYKSSRTKQPLPSLFSQVEIIPKFKADFHKVYSGRSAIARASFVIVDAGVFQYVEVKCSGGVVKR